MQDIRKPYTRSKSSRDISHRVEEFETNDYSDDELDDEESVRIPNRSFRNRRNLDHMEMFPKRRREGVGEEKGGRGDIVYRDPRTRYMKSNKSFGTWAFIITVLVLAVGTGLLTYVFNSATVTITPKYQDMDNFRKTFNFSQNSADTNSIPFIVATTSLTSSKVLTLSETKKVEAKASGKIIIYNNYDSSEQKLIKNTRFETPGGKIYRINQSVTIPGKSGTTPGSVEVTVYADSYGADYNSAPADFTIPGFKGTPRFTAFFARSDGPITGGSSGNMSLASQSDVNAAKDELALETAQKIKSTFSIMKKDGYIGLYSAVEVTYKDNEVEVLQGKTSTYEVTATGYLIFASAAELANKVAFSARDYKKGDPVRLDYTEMLNYTRKDTDKISALSKLDVLVGGNSRLVWITDESILKKLVAGKKRAEFESLMGGISSIKGAEIGFSPLWLMTFPDNVSKIKVVESLPKR